MITPLSRQIGKSMLRALAMSAMIVAPGLAFADAHPLTAKDMAMMDRATDPHVSPDGRAVVYDLRSTNWDNNAAVHALWLLNPKAKDPAPHRLAASDGGATYPRWSPDGRFIYFLSSRTGTSQVWRTDAAGAEPMQITKLPLDVGSYRLSPDGKALVVSMGVFPDCESLACTRTRLDAQATGKPSGVLYSRLFIRHWDTWADGTRNHLFAMALAGDGAPGPAVDIMPGLDADSPTKPFGDDADYAVTPDGRAVIFAAKRGAGEAWSTNFDLWRAPLDGSARPEDLTAANPAADQQPVISPDGSRLAWRAQKRPGFESDRYGVMVMDLKSGAAHEVDQGWDRSPDRIAWSADGRTLYLVADDLGQSRLFALDPDSGKVRALTGDGHATDFDVTHDGVVFASDAFNAPAQLFRVGLKGGKAVQLTRHNAERLAGMSFGAYEPFSFAGWNGETVHGFVFKPADYQPGKKYPVALLIHGGPQAYFGNQFHYRWNPEAYAGAGYAVVIIDFHGSVGYGQAFTDSISRHWGDRPLEDLQKGWAYALSTYGFLDGGRACALGASYGGFMINWIAGNWNGPWKCLVSHDGIFDNRAVGYSTEELWFSEWENGGTAYEHPENYERFNPADHVAVWSKPELVIHSARDYRLPLEQGIGAFTALQRKGVPSELLTFPDENHWVVKPQNLVQWHDTVFAWMKRWTGEPQG